MSYPTIPTVRKAILVTPVKIVGSHRLVSRGRRREHFGSYDHRPVLITLGKRKNRAWGQADEMVGTLIHEALHRLRPTWREPVVRQMEKRYAHSRVLREAALLKILNVVLFGRDLDLAANVPGVEVWGLTRG